MDFYLSNTDANRSDANVSTGTVSVTQGSAAVVGTSTTWNTTGTGKLAPRMTIVINGRSYQVKSVNSDTSLSLQTAYLDATASALTYYAIGGVPVQPFASLDRAIEAVAASPDTDNLILVDSTGTAYTALTYTSGSFAFPGSQGLYLRGRLKIRQWRGTTAYIAVNCAATQNAWWVQTGILDIKGFNTNASSSQAGNSKSTYRCESGAELVVEKCINGAFMGRQWTLVGDAKATFTDVDFSGHLEAPVHEARSTAELTACKGVRQMASAGTTPTNATTDDGNGVMDSGVGAVTSGRIHVHTMLRQQKFYGHPETALVGDRTVYVNYGAQLGGSSTPYSSSFTTFGAGADTPDRTGFDPAFPLKSIQAAVAVPYVRTIVVANPSAPIYVNSFGRIDLRGVVRLVGAPESLTVHSTADLPVVLDFSFQPSDWTLSSGKTYTYQRAQSGAPGYYGCWQNDVLDTYGNKTVVRQVGSINEVEAVAGTWFYDTGTSTMYVRPFGGGAAGTRIDLATGADLMRISNGDIEVRNMCLRGSGANGITVCGGGRLIGSRLSGIANAFDGLETYEDGIAEVFDYIGQSNGNDGAGAHDHSRLILRGNIDLRGNYDDGGSPHDKAELLIDSDEHGKVLIGPNADRGVVAVTGGRATVRGRRHRPAIIVNGGQANQDFAITLTLTSGLSSGTVGAKLDTTKSWPTQGSVVRGGPFPAGTTVTSSNNVAGQPITFSAPATASGAQTIWGGTNGQNLSAENAGTRVHIENAVVYGAADTNARMVAAGELTLLGVRDNAGALLTPANLNADGTLWNRADHPVDIVRREATNAALLN